jgi:Tol biopolymer transport system component
VAELGKREPVFSPDGKFVAYVENSSDPCGICLLELSTCDVTDLTYGWSPDWSPDGKWIVYVWAREIYKINVETEESMQLTAEGFFPDWSPNNQYVAFSINSGDSAGLYIIDSSGNSMHSVGDWGWLEPDWHRQGSMLTFIGWIDNKGGVCIVDTNGSNANLILEGGDSPVFSPDGSKIAYVSENDNYYDIFLINTDGTNEVQLTFEPESDNGYMSCEPAWSPDGNQIVYARVDWFEDEQTIELIGDLWIMDADGKNKRQLTNN